MHGNGSCRDQFVTRYSRQDVLRILHLRARQLTAWEQAGLIPANEQYSFEDLAQLRTLRALRATRISAKSIRESVEAMRRAAGMGNPFTEASAVSHGAHLSFRHNGALVDPVTRQLAFDFEAGTKRQLSIVGSSTHATGPEPDLQELFQRAVALEENQDARPRGHRPLTSRFWPSCPPHAPSCINLGTIFYNPPEFLVRPSSSTAAPPRLTPSTPSPSSTLATCSTSCIVWTTPSSPTSRALKLLPQYADAHYNLALAYERKNEKRRALRHWLSYVRLDPVGPWAGHAKAQARKIILRSEKLCIVSRHGRLVAAG